MTETGRCVLLMLCSLLLGSCATPTMPTGGPPDNEGPVVTRTVPASGTTDFRGRTIELHFSEFVNRGSLPQALTLEPEIGIGYSLDWGRRSVALELDEPLPDTTTLIVTIGTELSDMNGNRMVQPDRVAVSSGPDIDEAELLGRIRDARTGEGTGGLRVLLYRRPVNLEEPALYTAETDTGGQFSFSWLRQGSYQAIWVDDRNRNKRWDREQERAQPFDRQFLSLDRGGTDTLNTLYLAQADTAPPSLQGVGLFSNRRMRMRFNENVELQPETEIGLADSAGTESIGAYPLYVDTEEPYVLYAQSLEDLDPERTYRAEVRNIADESGNLRSMTADTFTGSDQADTTLQRIIEWDHPDGIFPDEPLRVTYAAPIADDAVADSLQIAAGTELVAADSIRLEQNRLIIGPDGEWRSGVTYEFRLWNPATETRTRVTPEIWHDRDLGGLAIALSDTTDSLQYRLQLVSEERGTVADTVFTRQIELDDLPPLSYRVILWHDRNGNGLWDPGTADPWRRPEPYLVRTGIPVESGFTGDMEVHIPRQNGEGED